MPSTHLVLCLRSGLLRSTQYRIWSRSKKAKPKSIWRRIDGFHERNPLFCSIGWAGVKGTMAAAMADLILQTAQAKKQPDVTADGSSTSSATTTTTGSSHSAINTNKAAAFGLWSGFYCGGILKALYNDIFPKYFPLVNPKNAALKHPLFARHAAAMILIDNFVSTPFFFNPSYFVIKSSLEGLCNPEDPLRVTVVGVDGTKSTAAPPISAMLLRAKDRYREEWLETCSVTWSFWIPLHCLTFTVIPPHWRVPFTAGCSLFTLAAQSMNQSQLEEKRKAREANLASTAAVTVTVPEQAVLSSELDIISAAGVTVEDWARRVCTNGSFDLHCIQAA